MKNYLLAYIFASASSLRLVTAAMSDDPVCVEQTHDFWQHHEALLAGYKCTSDVIFYLVLASGVLIVLAQNYIGTRDGQASRRALTLPKHSRERDVVIRELLVYTFAQSVLSTVHILLVVGLNFYVLLALMAGNVLGTYLSFRSQKQDKHDPSGDLCAILNAIKEHPDDPKLMHVKRGLQMWLVEKPKTKCKDVIVRVQKKKGPPLQISSGSGKNIRSRFAQSEDLPRETLDL